MIDEKETTKTAVNTDTESKPEKKGAFSDLAKKAWSGIKGAANDVKEFAEGKIEQHKEHEAFKKAYVEATYLYEFRGIFDKNGKPKNIRAFRDQSTKEIHIYTDEDNVDLILSDTIIVNTEDKSISKIITVEKRSVKYHDIAFLDKHQSIRCYVASYERYIDEKVSTPQVIHNEVHQNVSISGNNSGEISLNSNIQLKFDQIERDIRALKISPLNFKAKKQQEEALTIIGPVRDCIINGKKDDSIVKRFIDILLAIAPALATIVMSI